MYNNLEEIKATLKKYKQEHLLNHFDELEESKKKKLIDEIKNINFELMDSLYRKTENKKEESGDEITPIDYLDKYKLKDEYKYYENIGKRLLRKVNLQLLLWQGDKEQDWDIMGQKVHTI